MSVGLSNAGVMFNVHTVPLQFRQSIATIVAWKFVLCSGTLSKGIVLPAMLQLVVFVLIMLIIITL